LQLLTIVKEERRLLKEKGKVKTSNGGGKKKFSLGGDGSMDARFIKYFFSFNNQPHWHTLL